MAYYCNVCGKPLQGNERVCPYCGALVPDNQEPVKYSDRWNGLAIAGFVISLISLFCNFCGTVGIVGIILSAVGMTQSRDMGERGSELAVAGLIIGIISTVWAAFVLLASC